MGTDPEDNGDGHIDEFDESEGFDPADLVTITDEDGVEIDCAILAVIEHDDDEFALLGRLDQLREDVDELEMFIFRYTIEDDGTQTFAAIEDDETYDAVRDAFSLLISQEDGDEDGEE
ncbi:MAG: DUF1292 domain-containing protein [Myxococcota bacterium]